MRTLLKKTVNILLVAYILILVLGLAVLLQTLLPILNAHGIQFREVVLSSEVDLTPVIEDVQFAMENKMPVYAKKLVILAFDN